MTEAAIDSGGFEAPEAVAARTEIETLKSDKAFFDKLMSKDEGAGAKWAELHRTGFPARAPVSPEDLPAHEAARTERAWNDHFAWLRTQWAVTPEQEKEIRGGVIRKEFHDWALAQRDLLVKDRGFYQQLMSGDMKAKERWGRTTAMLGLRPVSIR